MQRKLAGSAFHAEGPATEKARSPRFVRVLGTAYNWKYAETTRHCHYHHETSISRRRWYCRDHASWDAGRGLMGLRPLNFNDKGITAYFRTVGGPGFIKCSRGTVCACNAGYLHCYCMTRWESKKLKYVATAITTTATVAWISRGFVVPDVDCSVEVLRLVTNCVFDVDVSWKVILPALQSDVWHGQSVASTCRLNLW